MIAPARTRLPAIDRNGWLLLGGKAARAFAFGLNSVALGLYLAELGLDGAAVGAVLTAALAGTALLTSVIAVAGDRLGRRRVLVVGSLLMLLALAIPSFRGEPIALILVALTGMVSVTANEATGLHTVDQAILPQTVASGERTSAFALYGVIAFVTTAVGAAAIGPIVFLGTALGLEGADRYAPAFAVYALAGLLSAGLVGRIDARAEVGERIAGRFAIKRSRGVVARLSALFALDAFAGGLAVPSFMAYWFASQLGFDPASIGLLFFVGSLLAAASFPASARLADRFGLIRTAAFTHIAGSALLLPLAIVPPSAGLLAGILFLARSALASMDVPARQSYVMAVVDPSERTAAAGLTNLARAGALTVGPVIAGVLLVPIGPGVPLIACGTLKIGYDVLLYRAFRDHPAPGERHERPATEPPAPGIVASEGPLER